MTVQDLEEALAFLGVKVTYQPLESSRGVLLRLDDGWWCLISDRLGPGERLWTLAHELFHRIDSLLPAEMGGRPRNEREIDRAVARLLLPAEALRSLRDEAPDLYSLEEIREWTRDKAESVGLSFSATCFYLEEAGLMSRTVCEALVAGSLRSPRSSKIRRPGRSYPAPVLEPEQEARAGDCYRRPGEPPCDVRCCEPPPPGFDRCVAPAVPVAGVRVEAHRLALEGFLLGSRRSLSLMREPDNDADGNAVAVRGRWRDRHGRWTEGRLGYLPRPLVARIARDLEPEAPLEATLVRIYLPGFGKSAGLRLAVWTKEPQAL
ncbi:MAG: hypothetical protein LLG93_10300 [Deltaproteobacteria bacterium]|nr:hypothetical protein [Deltaproteobacteria bacterium]